MASTIYFSTKFLEWLLQGKNIPGLILNYTVDPITTLYISLHTSIAINSADTQDYLEVSYPGYARVAVPRSELGFYVDNTTGEAGLTAPVEFAPVPSGSYGTAWGFMIGTDATGVGTPLIPGQLTPAIPLSTGVVPRLGTEQLNLIFGS